MTTDGSGERTDAVWFWLAVGAIALGLYARLKGLGRWPLAEDEFYMARSIAHLAEHGLPAVDCRTGAHYLRGIAYQLLVAPLFALGISAETALRAVTVATNLAVIPALALLGRRIGGKPVAAVTVVFFALSVWEVEFARFGRMYAPFQAIFVWHLYFLQRNALERGAQWPLLALSCLGVLTWEGGIFLACLNFLPLLVRGRSTRIGEWFAAAAVLIWALAYLYNPGGIPTAALPPDMSVGAAVASGVLLPRVLALALPDATVWAVAALVPGAIGLWALRRCLRARAVPAGTRIALAVTVVLALLNQWLAILAWIALAALLGWISLPVLLRSRPGRGTLLSVLAISLFWLAFGVFSTAWHGLLPAFDSAQHLHKLGVVLLKYPDVYAPVIWRWQEAMPVFSLILTFALPLAAVVAMGGDSRQAQRQRLILAVVLVAVMLVGILPTRYVSTRYTFFLLPCVFLLTAAALNAIAQGLGRRPVRQNLVLAAGMLATGFLSEDVSLRHLFAVDSMESNFRLTASVPEHLYLRYDYRGPARFVRAHRSDGDLVISGVLPATWYMDRVDYVYVNQRRAEFPAYSCAGGELEKWTGERLFHRPDMLENFVDSAAGPVWIVLDSEARAKDDFDHPLFERFGDDIVYRSVDDRIDVYRIDPPQAASE